MSDEARHARFLRFCIDEAVARTRAGHGGPFAALVEKDDRVIAVGFNEVPSLKDPTAHAEVQAIRAACRTLGTFQLAGCAVYASCEPCPMCLGAIYWARPDAVYFAATRHDAAAAGFDDARLYDELTAPLERRRLPMHHIPLAESGIPFNTWAGLPNRVPY